MQKALFLDRDGVVNVDTHYLYRIEDVVFVDGIFDLAKAAQDKGYKIILVTNQAGIGRGKYTEDDFHILMDWMREQFEAQGATIDGVYFCPNHPEKGIGKYKVGCNDRKPAPGMLIKAIEEYGLDPAQSIMVGDKASDLQAAQAAGVPTRILIPTEYESEAEEATHVHESLIDIIELL